MKAISLLWILAASLGDVNAGDLTGKAQQEAVSAFPDLGKADSPLHSKFLELYRRAKDSNSPVLTKPDWPLVLARQANDAIGQESKLTNGGLSKATSDVPLESVTLLIPASGAPDFEAGKSFEEAQRDWQKAHSHKITVRAHFFNAADGAIRLEKNSESLPEIHRVLTRLKAAAAGANLDDFKTLLTSESRTNLDLALRDPEHRAEFISNMPQLEPTAILFLLDIDGIRAAAVINTLHRTSMLCFASVDGRLFLDVSTLVNSRETNAILSDIGAYLNGGGAPEGLISK